MTESEPTPAPPATETTPAPAAAAEETTSAPAPTEETAAATEASENGAAPAQDATAAGNEVLETGIPVAADDQTAASEGTSTTVASGDDNTTTTTKIRNAFGSFKTKTSNAFRATAQTVKDKSQQVRERGSATMASLQEKGKQVAQARRSAAANNAEIIVDTEEEGLEQLKQMVENAKATGKRNVEKWAFESSPLECFEKTKDDLMMAFVRWSRMNDAVPEPATTTAGTEGETAPAPTPAPAAEDSLEAESKYNITKAFRRLESYANWMSKTGTDMLEPKLTTESIEEAWKVWNLKVSYDKSNRLVWWLDMDSVEAEAIQQLKPVESLRLFCWFAHYVLLDRHAQQYGMVLVQNWGKKHLLQHMSLMPPKLMLKIDRLTIGTMPVKTKQLYIVRTPQWAKLVMGLVSPFLSQKMRERIVTLADSKFLEDLLGADCIPQEFPGCEGKLERDVVWATYFAG